MFGSNVLEVASGLVFVYMLLSLLCSTINEQVIARFFALRAKNLEAGITNMLANSQGDTLVQQFYENPLIKGLSQNAGSGKARKPSYIPADIFALALMDIVQPYKNDLGAVNRPIPETLALLIKQAQGSPDAPAIVLASIEQWFNDTMDRASTLRRK